MAPCRRVQGHLPHKIFKILTCFDAISHSLKTPSWYFLLTNLSNLKVTNSPKCRHSYINFNILYEVTAT